MALRNFRIRPAKATWARGRAGWSVLLGAIVTLAAAGTASGSRAAESGDWGEKILQTPGCNASSPSQIPGQPDLFVNRQMLTAQGQIAGVSGPNDCSGADPKNQQAGGVYNRWSLALDRLDWATGKFMVVKPLLDTSLDPQTGRSRAVVTGGPMRGAIIRSAYDADMVVYRGRYVVSFECTLEDDKAFGVDGTSACIGIYDPSAQAIDMSTVQVIISGIHSGGRFYAASVPILLAFHNHLYLYWSALVVEHGRFSRISTRGAEIGWRDGAFAVRGSDAAVVHSTDEPGTVEVWGVDSSDPTSDTTVNINDVWAQGDSVVAMASVGGQGCADPSGVQKGCFHLVMIKTRTPLAPHAFNAARRIGDDALPSNPQEYTKLIRDERGDYWFVGHFIRPVANGFADQKPVPKREFWNQTKGGAVLAAFPFSDRDHWPREGD